MDGYQLTFYTQQDRQHEGRGLAQWVMDEALKLGVRGATMNASVEGIGHDGKSHMVNMFDLSEQPIQVTIVAEAQACEALLDHFKDRGLNLFYTKMPVSFGYL
ncbi:DUF190 domain-containing protein [Marinobacterium mangrovicola]|uniref:PII-like signaling protein n=1 Tax=Marinobacterium mangrovicola TaxID=1476959 RepID=A0A4R1GJD1_9GAMM|nr:DUF190 domain-containing protein [Marinobacterium mangrovicola]TCK06079.1 PII-like signaling protein [Marinobacterium mangrovicola]